MSPKRQVLVALVVLVLVALAVSVLAIRENRMKVVPRLVVVGYSEERSQRVVVFRLHVSDQQAVKGARIVNAANGDGGEPIWGVRGDLRGLPYSHRRTALEFNVVPPNESVWRLKVQTIEEQTGRKAWFARVRACWQAKGLSPLDAIVMHKEEILSEPITNSLLITTAPSR